VFATAKEEAMHSRFALVVAAIVLVGLVSGCATTRKKNDLESQSLRNQLIDLQAEMQSKDEQIMQLKQALLSKMQQDRLGQETNITSSSDKGQKPSIKLIQQALKGAGYNPGSVDGKMGRQTREAIRAFQKANGLKADGKVGKETWSILRKHLDERIK
jgi:peptidoglycan hydrolase-like protein with peptidoglycan-binding domain